MTEEITVLRCPMEGCGRPFSCTPSPGAMICEECIEKIIREADEEAQRDYYSTPTCRECGEEMIKVETQNELEYHMFHYCNCEKIIKFKSKGKDK